MSQSFIKKPDNGPHSALAGLGVLRTEIAAKVEGWACHGLGVVPLTPEQRAEVIEFALDFKDYSRETLEALSDQSLVNAAYGSWSDFLRSLL